MIPLIIIIILSILLLITLLLSMKVILQIRYEGALTVSLRVLFIKIQLYPSKSKFKKKPYPHSMSKRKAQKIKDELSKDKPKKKKKKSEKAEKVATDSDSDSPDIASMISIITSFVKNFLKLFAGSVRIRSSLLHITVAAEDAAETAVAYGAVSQAINILFPIISSVKNFKRLPKGKELWVKADFLSEKSTVDVNVELYVRVAGALKTLILSVYRAFRKAVKKQMLQLDKLSRSAAGKISKKSKSKKKKKSNTSNKDGND